MHAIWTVVTVLVHVFAGPLGTAGPSTEKTYHFPAFAVRLGQVGDHHQSTPAPKSDRLQINGTDIDEEENTERGREQTIKLPAFRDSKSGCHVLPLVQFLPLESAFRSTADVALLTLSLRC